MDLYEEIAYREKQMQKWYAGERPTREDRFWAQTHSVVQLTDGVPHYKIAVEPVTPKQWYSLEVQVESVGWEPGIIPIVSAPAGKGKIWTPNPVVDFYGRPSQGKPIKMLACGDEQPTVYSVMDYYSDLGLLAVQYQFLDTAHWYRPMMIGSSDPRRDVIMQREPVDDHTIRYRCKHPQGDGFDGLVFTVSWTEISGPRYKVKAK